MSGFNGRKVMMVYNVPQETIEYLKNNGWELYGGQLREHIILQRFRDIYKLLSDFDKNEVIIWTDVKDVVFQVDPSEWLDKNKTGEILACSECIRFKSESWAVHNAGTSFPLEWEWLQHELSYCAGCIVGDVVALRDLFIEIYHWSKDTSNPGQLSDQAAYNVLIHLNHFKENVQFVPQEAGLATQLGTVVKYKDSGLLNEPTPKLLDDVVVNQNDEPFVIVHQYDRFDDYRTKILNKYE
jgi:hypothetical protein